MKKILAILAICLLVGPASAQFISSGGSGTGGSVTPCTTTAGAIQYNNAGAFGCVSNATSGGASISVTSSGLVIGAGGAVMKLGGDATGDVYTLNNAVTSRVAIGASGQVLTVQGSTGLPFWTTASASSTPCTTTASSLQYNNAAVFGCVSGITSDGTSITATGSAIKLGGAVSGSTALAAANAASGTLTLPAATDTVATLGLNQTFTGTVTATQFFVTGVASMVNLHVTKGTSEQNLTITGITGVATNCLNADTNGNVSGTGSSCGPSTITAGTTGTSGYSAGQIVYSDGSHAQATSGLSFTLPSVPTASVLAISAGVVTTNVAALNITETWNNGSTTFDAPLFMNVTNTASVSGSLLADFQVGGTTQYGFYNAPGNGALIVGTSNATVRNSVIGGGGIAVANSSLFTAWAGTSQKNLMGAGFFEASSDTIFGWSNSTAAVSPLDTKLSRFGAGILGLTNATNPTGFQVYNTTDDVNSPTNYERGILDWTVPANANSLTIGAQASGTGTQRGVIVTGASISLPGVLSNVATTSAVCYNTSTGLLSFDGTIGTCNTSSLRFKHDIHPLTATAKPLDAVMAMQPISFYYNSEQNTPGEQISLPAENLAGIDPRMVAYDRDGKPVSLRVFAIIGYLTAAIQQQQTEIADLKRRLH